MFPYVLLKSVILVRMLKWNISFPTHLCIPPIVTLKYITNQRNEDLLSFFNGIEDIYAVYWMGGLSPDSYIGSSMKVYYSMRSSEASRYDNHFNHANKHRSSISHKCKQPRLYTAMGQSTQNWFILPVAIFKGSKRLVRSLRRIEINIIRQCNPRLNVTGSPFQCLKRSRFGVIMSPRKDGCTTSRSKKRPLSEMKWNVQLLNRNMSGILSKFWYGGKKVFKDPWFNLHAMMTHILKKNLTRCNIFGVYASSTSDLTNYASLYHHYGSLVTERKITFYQEILKAKRRGGYFHLRITNMEGHNFRDRSNDYFEKFANLNSVDLNLLSIDICLNLWANRVKVNKFCKNKSAKFTSMLAKHIIARFGFVPKDEYRLVIPFQLPIQKNMYQKILLSRLRGFGYSPQTSKFITSRIRIVQSYSRSLKSLMDNSKKAARAFNPMNPPTCTCPLVKSLGMNCGASLGHLWIKCTEVTNPLYKDIFGTSANSIPIPANIEIEKELQKSVNRFLSSACKDILVVQEDERFQVVRKKDLENRTFMSEKQVSSAMKSINLLVTGFLDKNGLASFSQCQKLFWLKMKETYVDDLVHYEITSALSEKVLLDQLEEWYVSLCCSIPLANKSKWCIPGYATFLVKDKDTNNLNCNYRVRPLIGASREGKCSPMKSALRVINKAIFFLMRVTNHKGMWLNSCLHLVPDLKRKTDRMKQAYGIFSRFDVFSYDIKEFFTSVNIESLYPAIKFFVTENDLIKLGKLWVHKRSKSTVLLVPPDIESAFYCITIEQIVSIIMYEFKNGWFLLGESLIARQKAGLSIGGHLSSAEAIMLANFAEHKALSSSLYQHKFFYRGIRVIDGVRATDDALIFTVGDVRNPNCLVESKKILELFKALFLAIMGNLVLEFDDHADCYEFTENIITNVFSEIIVSYNNKNFQSLITCGAQKIIKGAHPSSLSSNSIKVNTISNSMVRIGRCCSLDSFTIEACLKYIYEVLVSFKWPISWIYQALKNLNARGGHSQVIWHLLFEEQKLLTLNPIDALVNKLLLRILEIERQNVDLISQRRLLLMQVYFSTDGFPFLYVFPYLTSFWPGDRGVMLNQIIGVICTHK